MFATGKARHNYMRPRSAHMIAALSALCDGVIEPVLANVRSPYMGRNSRPGLASAGVRKRFVSACRLYFRNLDIQTAAAQWHRQHSVDRESSSA